VPLNFDIDIQLNKEFRIFNLLDNDVKDAIGQSAVSEIRKNFRAGGRPNKWKKSKRAKGQGKKKGRYGKTLQDDGTLRDATDFNRTSDGIELVNNIEYAAIHNYGGTINHPGGTPYIVVGSQGGREVRWLKKDGSYPPQVKFTKPHTIRIPKREFMILPDNFDTKVQQIMRDRVRWID
jgi:phage gpG-like protein